MSARSRIGRAAALLVFLSTVGAVDRARIDRETQRLTRLEGDLREVGGGEDPRTPEQHVEDVSREIEAAERRLRAPFGHAFPIAHEEYHRARLVARAREQAESLRTLREAERELLAPELDRDHAANLAAWKTKLEAELARPPEDLERDLAASDEQQRWRAERESLERRVADLRASLRFWSRQRSGSGLAHRELRRRELLSQIEEQRAVLSALGGLQDARRRSTGAAVSRDAGP